MEVKLAAYTRLQDVDSVKGLAPCDSLIAHAIAKCYRTEPNDRAIRRCLESGHTSVFEHLNFTFDISDISRVCLAQLTRHRIASYTVESQRYVNYLQKSLNYIRPKSISVDQFADMFWEIQDRYNQLIEQGVPPEDARFMLPQAAATNLTMTINARSLFNFFNLRLDSHAQWEIRELAQRMLDIVYPLAPVTFSQYKDQISIPFRPIGGIYS